MMSPENKSALRQRCIQRRIEIAPADYTRWSQECSARLCYLVEALPCSCTVAGYHAIKGEIDISAAFMRLHTLDYPLALPVTECGNLLFRKWIPGDNLHQGQYGISHPHPHKENITPNIVVVPLAGFGRNGHRIGYGKGYYDRALHALRAQNPDLLAVGAAFGLQEIAGFPAGPHDERLDIVVTEREIIRV